ncbi:hypothetical protein GCM10029978_112600 [Actinoallomurus acanthiterrae]
MVSGLGVIPTRIREPPRPSVEAACSRTAGMPGAVEGVIQTSPGGGRANLVGEVRGGRVQSEVGAEDQGALPRAGQRVDGDDRRGADEAG